jgi:hypothetical protein
MSVIKYTPTQKIKIDIFRFHFDRFNPIINNNVDSTVSNTLDKYEESKHFVKNCEQSTPSACLMFSFNSCIGRLHVHETLSDIYISLLFFFFHNNAQFRKTNTKLLKIVNRDENAW